MKLDDYERRKFSVYCRFMADMEERALKAKMSLFEKQKIADELVSEMTKKDKMLIFSYSMVAEDLERWDRAETISNRDVGTVEDLKELK